MTPEEQRQEEADSIERERKAFERRQDAFFAVHRQFHPIGNGQVTAESMAELDNANAKWQAATADMDRIAEEIRSGKRR